MRDYKIISRLLWGLFALSVIACSKVDIDEGEFALGESVECKLNLKCGAMECGYGEPSTRSIATDSDKNEFQIENLWVVQFDAEGTVVGFPKYIADYDENSKVTLLNPGTNENEVLYLANTYNPNLAIRVKMSKEEVLSLSKIVEKVPDCFNYEGEKIRLMTSGMSTFTGVDLTSKSLPEKTLKSNVAKISFTIKYDGLDDDKFELKAIRLNNVCDKLKYYYSDEERDSGNCPLIEEFIPIDYPYINEVKETYTYYVPMNCRGKRDNTKQDPKLKPHYARPQDTYANIHTLVNGSPRDYKFYLGENLIDDFNIKSNHKYNYTITFNSTGEYSTDSRIEDYGEFDYTKYPSSNCYILNPSETSDRSYLIPVADRVNDYWTHYNNNDNNKLYNDSNWNCTLIWSDAESLTGTNNAKITFEQDKNNHLAMKVTLPAGFNHGNFVVGVKKENGVDYLWSWHFWVTDYRPSEVAKTLINNTDLKRENLYGVTGGEVHKYAVDGQTVTGEICYIMDRTIGARSIHVDDDFKGALFYQFGRKDPFVRDLVKLNEGGEVKDHYSLAMHQKMEYAIKHPATFITNNPESDENVSDWEGSITEYKATDIVWNDKNIKLESGKKSIFDPSPHGWRIPETNPFVRVSRTTGSILMNEMGTDISYYFKEGTGSQVSLSNYLAKFPVYGYIDGTKGTYIENKVLVYYWLCTPYKSDTNIGYGNVAYYHNNNNEFKNTYKTRAWGIQIRPIYYADDFIEKDN